MERRGLTLGLEREKTSAINAVSQLPGHSCTTDHIPSSHNNGFSSDAVCFVPLPLSRASPPKKPQPMDAMPSFRHPVAVPTPQHPKPRINSPSGTPLQEKYSMIWSLIALRPRIIIPGVVMRRVRLSPMLAFTKTLARPCVASLSPGNLPLSGQHWTQQSKLRGRRLEGKANHLIRERKPPSRALSAAETQG